MQISPGLGVAIMFNNYAHDVATALLISSAFTLHSIARVQKALNNPVATLFFVKAYDMMTGLFRFALWWIILGGIPRTIFYTSFEWANAADKLQVPALAIKHVLLVTAVVWGIIAWRRLKRKVEGLRASLPADAAR
ncbi:MAG TPA: hypothetical protein VIU41_13855 [Geobacteraceae bacterium]